MKKLALTALALSLSLPLLAQTRSGMSSPSSSTGTASSMDTSNSANGTGTLSDQQRMEDVREEATGTITTPGNNDSSTIDGDTTAPRSTTPDTNTKINTRSKTVR